MTILPVAQFHKQLFPVNAQPFCHQNQHQNNSKQRQTPEETALLPMGAKVMTYECGMRFLMDYLQGDRYFKIHRDGQNLDRARTQLTLVADMERKMQQMQDIVRKAAG